MIFHSHATLDKEGRGNDQKGMNFIDTCRIEEGRIIEHWDSIQALDLSMRLYSLFQRRRYRKFKLTLYLRLT
ncbi:protein of unknown function [Vibrio tapetis subsp. tapetis]|uniref:SnoaL-like domain-containing protein n=1 Tax=Vibrio tapetis subsp. tapetis TaxID=1671868 RepID=A0A2N8ZJJ2_9VIBR|nr:protein of unknown function [Vibrio tapetis subsp. tapetis]